MTFWNHHGFWQLIGAIFSAYLGGLLAIALEDGLWEINLPPPLHVKNEVHQHHLQLIGKPRSGPRLKHLFVSQISVGLDLRLLTLAFLVVFWLRWQKNWNGRIPHRWLHLDNSSRINPALGLKPDFGRHQPSHRNREE